MKTVEIECKNPFNQIKNKWLPYHFDLNVYRGCTHGCEYCFARYSHRYLAESDFFNCIFVKTNAAEALEKTLSRMRKLPDIINLGGVTDNYQPMEETYRIMPDIWRVLIRHKIPVIISTKSDLILRDIGLISELNRVAAVNVAVTITTMDAVWQKLEPGAKVPAQRLDVLKEAKSIGAVTGAHVMPVIPHITDREGMLDEVLSSVKNARVDYAIVNPLNLRGETANAFFGFLRREFGELVPVYKQLYSGGSLDAKYQRNMLQNTVQLCKKHGISRNYLAPIRRKIEEKSEIQLSFLELL